jgi:hypothetical protein
MSMGVKPNGYAFEIVLILFDRELGEAAITEVVGESAGNDSLFVGQTAGRCPHGNGAY